MLSSTLAFGPLGGWELVVIAVVGLLIFGKRLPEVGRSLGKGIVEFKKGLQGIEDDVNAVDKTASASRRLNQDSSAHLAASDRTREPAHSSDDDADHPSA